MMKKSKCLAFVLSAIPGVGHYYLGLMQRGLQFNLAFFGLFAVTGLTGLEFLNVLAAVVWFYAAFDALQTAALQGQGEPLADRPLVPWNRVVPRLSGVGWALIILGLLTMVRNNFGGLLPRELRTFDWQSLLVALFLIGFGLYLLRGYRTARTEEETP